MRTGRNWGAGTCCVLLLLLMAHAGLWAGARVAPMPAPSGNSPAAAVTAPVPVRVGSVFILPASVVPAPAWAMLVRATSASADEPDLPTRLDETDHERLANTGKTHLPPASLTASGFIAPTAILTGACAETRGPASCWTLYYTRDLRGPPSA